MPALRRISTWAMWSCTRCRQMMPTTIFFSRLTIIWQAIRMNCWCVMAIFCAIWCAASWAHRRMPGQISTFSTAGFRLCALTKMRCERSCRTTAPTTSRTNTGPKCNMVSVVLETAPAGVDILALREGLRAFNVTSVPELLSLPGDDFNVVAYNERGEIIGGAVVEADLGWLFVDTLWVADE